MEKTVVSQLVFGDRFDRFYVRRMITAAIDHICSAEDRLVDSQAAPLAYEGEYNHQVVEIVNALIPVQKMLCALRRSTYARESARETIDVRDPTVQRVLRNERAIAMGRIEQADRLIEAGTRESGERYPCTVGSHPHIEHIDGRED